MLYQHPVIHEQYLDEKEQIFAQARLMTETFLQARKNIEGYEGYVVRLQIDSQGVASGDWNPQFYIEGCGKKSEAIILQNDRYLNSCKKCASLFHHTFANYELYSGHPFCRLVDAVKPFGMLPVFSMSNNLLLVPNFEIEKYPHLFALSEDQLSRVFKSLTAALLVLNEMGYTDADVEWHVGTRGGQTVGINHTRIQKIPKNILLSLKPEVTSH